MRLSIEIGDKEILEALAEKYPNVMISLEEIKHQLESRFADLLSFGDGDYEWRLGNDQYFKSLNELANDKQSEAEEAIAEGNIEQRQEDIARYYSMV